MDRSPTIYSGQGPAIPLTARRTLLSAELTFSGKQVFSQATARIHGSVYFTDESGAAAQPMQGVNVVARWIDPATNQLSGTAVASSISGFLFCGNAGNIITGFLDSTGQNLNRFGSNDTTLEGFFDLAGLQIPNGASTAQYQLSIESVDPLRSTHTGPYGATSQVQPSGSAQPIVVTVSLGGGYCAKCSHARERTAGTAMVWRDQLHVSRAFANFRRLGR